MYCQNLLTFTPMICCAELPKLMVKFVSVSIVKFPNPLNSMIRERPRIQTGTNLAPLRQILCVVSILSKCSPTSRIDIVKLYTNNVSLSNPFFRNCFVNTALSGLDRTPFALHFSGLF